MDRTSPHSPLPPTTHVYLFLFCWPIVPPSKSSFSRLYPPQTIKIVHCKKYLVKMTTSEWLLQFQGSLNRWVIWLQEFPNTIIIHQPPHNSIKLKSYHRHLSASVPMKVHRQSSSSELDNCQQMDAYELVLSPTGCTVGCVYFPQSCRNTHLPHFLDCLLNTTLIPCLLVFFLSILHERVCD